MRVSNIVVHDLKHEAVALDMFYTAAPPEPVSERTPHVRNIHISGITGTARGAGVVLGLDEARIDDVTLTDIDVAAETGLVIRDADHVTLRSVRIRTDGGRRSPPRTRATCVCSTWGRWRRIRARRRSR